MKFKVEANGMYFEINIKDFISKYNSVVAKIESLSDSLKSKEELISHNKDLTSILESSIIKINKKKSEDSVWVVQLTWDIITWENGIYVKFSVINNSKKYTYRIKLLERLKGSKSWTMFWKKYLIHIQDLEASLLWESIKYGMKTPEVQELKSKNGFSILLTFWIIIWTFIYSITEAFSYFVW